MWVNIHEHRINGSHSVPWCDRHLAERCDSMPAHGKEGKQTKDTLIAMQKSSRTAEQLCQNFAAETLEFYLCSSPHPVELKDYAEVNEEYKVKGHDESYAVPKQGSSLNATVKPSSIHMVARAIPEGKQNFWGSFYMKGESHFTLDCHLFLLPQLRHAFHTNLGCSQHKRGGLKPHSYPSK